MDECFDKRIIKNLELNELFLDHLTTIITESRTDPRRLNIISSVSMIGTVSSFDSRLRIPTP